MAFRYVPIDEHTRFLAAMVRAKVLDQETEARARAWIYWIATQARHEHRDEIESLLAEPLPVEVRNADAHYDSEEHRAKCAAAYDAFRALRIPYKNGDAMFGIMPVNIPDHATAPGIDALERETQHLVTQPIPTGGTK